MAVLSYMVYSIDLINIIIDIYDTFSKKKKMKYNVVSSSNLIFNKKVKKSSTLAVHLHYSN